MPEHVSVRVPDDRTALQAAVAAEPTSTREWFLRRAVLAGGTLAVGGVVVAGLPRLAASAAQSPEQDAEIFNFALLLEYTQAAFYAEAVQRAELPGELLEFAGVVAEHSRRTCSTSRRPSAPLPGPSRAPTSPGRRRIRMPSEPPP